MPISWRDLYASNQAAIAEAGIAPGMGLTLPPRGHARGVLPSPADRAVAAAGGASDSRRTLVHVPSGLDPRRPAPLVCMLHGCTQDPAGFAAATRMNDEADRHGFVVVYPGQDRRSNPQGCWNWFLPAHQRRDAGEPAAIVAIIHDLIDASARCTIDRTRIYVAGLSAGGAMAAILGVCYPDLFGAMAVHSGLPYGSATSMSSAFSVMASGEIDPSLRDRAAAIARAGGGRPVPSIVIHGTADRTVAPANASHVLAQSMNVNHLSAPDTAGHDPAKPTSSEQGQTGAGLRFTRSRWLDAGGHLVHELMMVDGLGHAWSGGAPGGSFTEPRGPSATEAIWAFFAETATTRERASAP